MVEPLDLLDHRVAVVLDPAVLNRWPCASASSITYDARRSGAIGLLTLPRLTARTPSTRRSTGRCVRPANTMSASQPARSHSVRIGGARIDARAVVGVRRGVYCEHAVPSGKVLRNCVGNASSQAITVFREPGPPLQANDPATSVMIRTVGIRHRGRPARAEGARRSRRSGRCCRGAPKARTVRSAARACRRIGTECARSPSAQCSSTPPAASISASTASTRSGCRERRRTTRSASCRP